jgi:hypothetical protein
VIFCCPRNLKEQSVKSFRLTNNKRDKRGKRLVGVSTSPDLSLAIDFVRLTAQRSEDQDSEIKLSEKFSLFFWILRRYVIVSPDPGQPKMITPRYQSKTDTTTAPTLLFFKVAMTPIFDQCMTNKNRSDIARQHVNRELQLEGNRGDLYYWSIVLYYHLHIKYFRNLALICKYGELVRRDVVSTGLMRIATCFRSAGTDLDTG